MIKQILHLSLVFWIVMDSLGNVPIFVAVLRHLEPIRQRIVIVRELLIALAMMVLFLFFGKEFFELLHIQHQAIEITGGIILLIISLPMIFSQHSQRPPPSTKTEPLVVPLAIPAIAGPAVLATITIHGSGVESNQWVVLIAIFFAWLFTLPPLLLAPLLKGWLGEDGLAAVECLFGYLLVLIAGQMVLQGLAGAFG
jgi:small neutral amino acid transporter SnatA (MarC family)